MRVAVGSCRSGGAARGGRAHLAVLELQHRVPLERRLRAVHLCLRAGAPLLCQLPAHARRARNHGLSILVDQVGLDVERLARGHARNALPVCAHQAHAQPEEARVGHDELRAHVGPTRVGIPLHP